jgi:hypothetical protein
VPLIPPTIARVRNASIFTKFDVRQGYNNIRIRKEDHHKAAFKTEFGIFVPNVMFFGLTNSPATFQRMMDSISSALSTSTTSSALKSSSIWTTS